MSEMKDHLLIALNGLEESHLARIAETLADRATWERIDEAAPEEIYADKLMTATALIGWPPVGALLESPVRFHQLPSAGYEKYAGQGLAKKPDYVISRVYAVEQIAEAVAGADHVVVVCPANESTKGLFDRRLLAAMKRGAFIYNLSRGVIIDTPALIAALQDGHLAGAGLDVFTAEPLPPQSPPWDMENVIITPHASGRSVKEHDRMCDLICDNLRRFFTAQPLINIIPL
jgi:D-isomer specific 2-hydroxyacid dehydrogenase, NAD binding domain